MRSNRATSDAASGAGSARSVLIAGGAGFVGTHLAVRMLDRGFRVVVLDNFLTGRRENADALGRHPRSAHLDIVTGDACDPPDLGDGFTAVVHLASPASPPDYLRYPLETLDVGAIGTRRLLEIARRSGARFLLASTSEVYGDPAIHPQPETYWGNVNPVGPRSVYDEAKRYAEALVTAYGRTTGLTVRIARIFNTYGPGMRFDDGRVIPTFVSQALRGEPLTLHGDGSQSRSYCYVSDLVEGLDALLWSGVEGSINIGNAEEYTVLETARMVLRLTGSRSEIVRAPRPVDDPHNRRPDLQRARTELGWSPCVPFERGLARTIADLAQRLDVDHPPGPNGDGRLRPGSPLGPPARGGDPRGAEWPGAPGP